MKKSILVFKISILMVVALWGTASSQEWIRDLSVNLVGTPVTVKVDIKPGFCPDLLNVKSQRVLPVAVVGTEDLDVTQIDSFFVLLEGVSPIRLRRIEDVSAPFDGGALPVCGVQCLLAI